MLKTQITVTDPNLLDRQLDAFEQSFGIGAGAAGEVIGYQMFAPDGGLLEGGADSPQDDRRSIRKASRVWDTLVLAGGQLLLTTKVIRFSINLSGAVAPQQTSDWLSLSEAFAFVFPAV